MKTINTVTGTTTTDKLGTTLMHEHLMVGWGGWELDCTAPRFERKQALKFATDRLKELRDLGLGTFLDPCPMDIGRDVNFMAEAASSAGIQLICATGLYKEEEGATPYWKYRTRFNDVVGVMADLFASEIGVCITSPVRPST